MPPPFCCLLFLSMIRLIADRPAAIHRWPPQQPEPTADSQAESDLLVAGGALARRACVDRHRGRGPTFPVCGVSVPHVATSEERSSQAGLILQSMSRHVLDVACRICGR